MRPMALPTLTEDVSPTTLSAGRSSTCAVARSNAITGAVVGGGLAAVVRSAGGDALEEPARATLAGKAGPVACTGAGVASSVVSASGAAELGGLVWLATDGLLAGRELFGVGVAIRSAGPRRSLAPLTGTVAAAAVVAEISCAVRVVVAGPWGETTSLLAVGSRYRGTVHAASAPAVRRV